MEKINIAALLKNCPRGMELDCTICEDLYFDYVSDHDNIIYCYIQYETYRTSITFNQHGAINNDIKSKCVIFPKGKTTWEGFIPYCKFKNGDVMAVENDWGIHIFIYNHTTDEYDGYGYYAILTSIGNFKINSFCSGKTYRLATEEEKEKLFDAIRANGYKWDPEHKTLEKLIEPEFKNGDVIVFENHWGPFISIFKENITERNGFIGHCVLDVEDNEFSVKDSASYFNKARFATKREKDQLFRAIENNGYTWNTKTKTLEKLIEPKFKVGDRIRHKSPEFRGERIVNICCDTGYFTTINDWIDIAHQDDWELVSNIEPKFKVGDRIKQIGSPRYYIIQSIEFDRYILHNNQFIRFEDEPIYELVPNKFDISTLVPFESRVLMRSSNAREWTGTIFSHYSNNKFYGCGMCCEQCIPYEGNEHLIGKTDDCDECFKNWK